MSETANYNDPVGTSSEVCRSTFATETSHQETFTPLSLLLLLLLLLLLYELRSTLLVSPTQSSMTNTCLTPLLTGETLW